MKFKTLFRLASVATLVSALFVAGCANTVRGAARDLNETGQAIEDAANSIGSLFARFNPGAG